MLLQFFGGVPMVYPEVFFFDFFPRNLKLNFFNLTICKLKSLVTGDFFCFFFWGQPGITQWMSYVL